MGRYEMKRDTCTISRTCWFHLILHTSDKSRVGPVNHPRNYLQTFVFSTQTLFVFHSVTNTFPFLPGKGDEQG